MTITRLKINARGWLGWTLYAGGDAVTRVARKVCDDVPTMGDHSGEFEAGRFVGQREGARQATAVFVEAIR